MHPLQFKIERQEDLGPFRDCLLDNEMDEEAEAVDWLRATGKWPVSNGHGAYYWLTWATHEERQAARNDATWPVEPSEEQHHVWRVFADTPSWEKPDHDAHVIPAHTLREAVWQLILAWPVRHNGVDPVPHGLVSRRADGIGCGDDMCNFCYTTIP